MMAKAKKGKSREVDLSQYDPSQDEVRGYDGEEPKKGIYDGALVSFKEHVSAAGNDGLEWQFDITDGPCKGWRGYVYSNEDSAMWKTEQICFALNGGENTAFKMEPAPEDGDGNASPTIAQANPVRLVVRRETYEGEPKGRIRTVLPDEEVDSGKGKKKSKKDKKGSEEPPF